MPLPKGSTKVRPMGVPYSVSPRADFEIVMAAVTQNGMALQFAAEFLRGNREIVMAAVASDGMALQFASHELKKDDDVVLAAVMQNILALQYAL